MAIDWSHLNGRTGAFASLEVIKDPSDVVTDVLGVGLHVRMSELVSHFSETGASTLTVFADTLVMDVDTLPAKGTVILARAIDLGAMKGGARPISVPTPASGTGAVQFAVGAVTGGQLALAQPDGRPPLEVPSGLAPINVASYFIDPDGSISGKVVSSPDAIGDLTGRIYALNSLRASFAASTWLMSSDAADAKSTARSMLAWVVACTGAPALGTAKDPTHWSELNGQAAPLLLTLNVAPGATYVPSLSSSFYKTEVSLLLDAVDSYADKIQSLKVATDIKAALEEVGGTLKAVARTELAPLDVQLSSLRRNLDDLSVGIKSLQIQFSLQEYTVRDRWTELQVALTEQKIEQWFQACFSMAMSYVKISFDAAKIVASEGTDLGAISDVITESLTAAKTAYEAIDNVAKDPSAGQAPLIEKARALVEMQQKLIQSYAVSAKMVAGADASGEMSLFAIDPAVAWDNYLAEASMQLSKLSVGAAGNYLVSLTVLANYGKAMAAKMATATAQQAQLSVVQTQKVAAEKASERWKDLEKKAANDQEKLAGLIGVLDSRADSNRRSVYVAWSHYRDSYFYLYLTKPPIMVDLDMSTAELRTAFAKAALWVGQALGDDPASGRVRLPDNDVNLTFAFDVCAEGAVQKTVDSALFSPASGGEPATLTWAIPMGTEQLRGVLPHDGEVAIWITDASFYLEGVTPNPKGNVIVKVATSGTYENGYGPERAYAFVAKSMVGNYAYAPGSGDPPYIKWRINTDVYMTPTPYTQWTMTFDPDGGDAGTATKLRMDVTVSFRTPA